MEEEETNPRAENEGQEEGMDVDELVDTEAKIQASDLEYQTTAEEIMVGEQKEPTEENEELPADASEEMTREFHGQG